MLKIIIHYIVIFILTIRYSTFLIRMCNICNYYYVMNENCECYNENSTLSFCE